ncbi:MAG: Gfo/Idh/MocA family oxidoreductase, partial [bacterium]
MSSTLTRREFVKTGAVATAAMTAVTSAQRVLGANERIRLGFIGIGNRGGQLLDPTLRQKDVDVVVLCDVYQPYLDKWAEKVGGDVATSRDFRQLIERNDIDAVFIATPDHWHAV